MIARGTHLTRVAYLLTGDQELANDLVQTVLARAMLSWRRIGKMSDIEAYLRRAMINERTSSWRKTRREVLTGAAPDVGAVPGPWASEPDLGELDAVIQALPYRQRAALVLRYYEDLDDAQIAAALDCAEATVRSLVHRALVTLRTDAAAFRSADVKEREMGEP